jgi:hypothetical protein
MKIKNYICLLAIILLNGCFQTGSETNTDGEYEVNLSGSDLNYVPTTEDQVEDPYYRDAIDALIEDIASAISDDPDFIDLVKAVAWTESTWRHYFEVDGHYYVFRGDNGHSFGIMQIYDKYHDERPVLQDNLDYGARLVYDHYLTAMGNDCSSGSNSGGDMDAILRRTYAQYNGGPSARCRDNDTRDTNLVNNFYDKPWLNYLP